MLKKKARFTERDKDQIEDLLDAIVDLMDIGWHWDEEDCLVVDGLDADPITFSNWRSAKAGLELFLSGYHAGMGDARCG